MIPKKIHYCWFGGKPLSPSAKKYMKTWKKYCPDYEIIEWNEDNFNVKQNQYCKEAYEAKKWAFVSDYARFWILYKYGGIYFDTDVEIIKPLDEIIEKGPFMGCESCFEDKKLGVNSITVAPGLGLGANPGLSIYKEILDLYDTLHFKNYDGSLNLKTVVKYNTEILLKYGLKNINQIQKCAGIYIYPKEYFCPQSFETGLIEITKNTYTIHHFDGSWLNNNAKIKQKIRYLLYKYLGIRTAKYLKSIKKFIIEKSVVRG